MIIYCNRPWKQSGYAKGGKGGGPVTFMGYLGDYLEKHNHLPTNDPDADYSLHFICIMGWKNIYKSLCKGIPIVLRLDNITSAPHMSRFYRIHTWPTIVMQSISTITVFQSNYCKQAWSFISDIFEKKPSVIIRNGANSNVFKPATKNKLNRNNRILLHEHFRRDDGGLKTVLNAFCIVKKKLPDSSLLLAGKLSDEIPELIKNSFSTFSDAVKTSINVVGPTNHSMLPELIYSADVYVHPIANSACPHTVLEVLSCGIPVICYSGTGPAEFVGDSGIVLKSEYEGVNEGFKRFPKEDPEQLANAIIEILNNKEQYKTNAIAISHLFSNQITCRKYLESFIKAHNTPPKTVSPLKALWLIIKLNFFLGLSSVIGKLEKVILR